MAFEDDRGWEYFVGNIPNPTEMDVMNSAAMQEHMAWHAKKENQKPTRSGNYGERFLDFHRDYIAKFDAFRQTKGLLPVSGWDPATKIPAALAHVRVLTAARDTDDPNSIDPHCTTPTWCTVAGGTDTDPVHGYTHLLQFKSVDELGWSIDSGWHGTVHNTIGGDMSQFHSPIDPVFWRWHKWIDDVRATWQGAQIGARLQRVASIVQILFGVTNDGPGIVVGPDGVPHHVPGGPGDPFILQLDVPVQDAMVGHLVRELAGLVGREEAKGALMKTATTLMSNFR